MNPFNFLKRNINFKKMRRRNLTFKEGKRIGTGTGIGIGTIQCIIIHKQPPTAMPDP
jgi:hypothetical protein